MDFISMLLQKLREGKLSSQELSDLNKVLLENPELLEQFLDEDLRKTKYSIDNKTSQVIWKNVSLKTSVKPSSNQLRVVRGRSRFFYYGIVAAVILILIVVGNWFIQFTPSVSNKIVQTGSFHEPKIIVLSDESKVWLNSNSKLIFPKNFSPSKREVELLGQAYFEVTEDKERPFIVKTDGLQTEVLGTSFDIKSSVGGNIQVALFSGKVKVIEPESKESWFLKPEQRLTFKLNESVKIDSFNPELTSAWRIKELRFDDLPLRKVIHTLNIHYKDQMVVVSDEAMLEEKINGTFRISNDLEDVLELICFNKYWELVKVNDNYFELVQ